MTEKVIAIFDIGRTNKKFLLYNQDYQIILEESIQPEDILDEDGFPCEDIAQITQWILQTLDKYLQHENIDLVAVNFSAHGAGLVYVDDQGRPLTPLYSYLKPFEPSLEAMFLSKHGDRAALTLETASPLMGMLNAGCQLYRLKQLNTDIFTKVRYAFHLPQYCSWLLHQRPISEITSIGCHTAMWDFRKNEYHSWLFKEDLTKILPPIEDSSNTFTVVRKSKTFQVGMGLHDSSAAMVPYFAACSEPFILVSTGTWSVTINPFNAEPLTVEELSRDCLCYLNFKGQPVKASRLFLGNEHEHQVKKLASYFKTEEEYYKEVKFSKDLYDRISVSTPSYSFKPDTMDGTGPFQNYPGENFNPNNYETLEEAYHVLIYGFITLQIICIELVKGKENITKLFVDGGFSKNKLFLKMLAHRLPEFEVFSAKLPQASSTGAAMVMYLQEYGFVSNLSKFLNMEAY